MKRYQPSRTAEYMAFFRALESARPAPQRLFNDPFAPYFVRPYLRRSAFIARSPFIASFVNRYSDLRLPGARTSAIARTKLIDDSLLDALRTGISQVVILGSGFDCRAYRLPQLNDTTVFEVDHPATLAAKLDRLRQALPTLPGNVRYVEIDFLRQTLPDVLAGAGFQSSRPAVFVWEGVSHYLTPEAVDSVLRCVASCSPGTRLIFTYVHAGMLDGSVLFKSAERLLRDFAGISEPWTFGLRPENVSAFLGERGLHLDRDLGARDYRGLYFGPAADRMEGYEFYHVAVAHV
jgi:methyltransferase (TIGR00027 family)